MSSASTGASARVRRFAPAACLPIAVALALLACYWFTLAPTITEGDSGELCMAVHTMGVAHPTGYPLYLIVGKLFDLLPLGEPARSIALLSAVSAAAAGGVICWMLISLTGSAAPGVLGGLAAGLNWWVWREADQAEVYAFHAFLVCLILAAFVRWLSQRTPARLCCVAFFCGVGLTHHRTALFFSAPLLLWAMAATRPLSARSVLRAAACGLLPLLLYLWLPLRAAHDPPLNWGNTSASLAFFIQHVSGRAYLPLAFGAAPTAALAETQLLVLRLWKQFGAAGTALILTGMVGLIGAPRMRPLGVSLAIGFVLVAAWSAFYRVPDTAAFYTAGMLVVALWCGAGLGMAVNGARRLKLGPAPARLVGAAAAAVALALPLSLLVKNWALADRSHQYDVLEATALSMAGVEPDAVVLLSGELQSSSLYYWHVLHPQSAPTLVPARLAFTPWCVPLLDPEIRAAVASALTAAADSRPAAFAYAIRERLDPDRPFYTNVKLDDAPAGYVLLRDPFLSRLVPPPGLPQAPDAAGAGPVLQLPGGAGSILGLDVPPEGRRGEPFAVTAAIRWTGRAVPAGDLRLVFAPGDAVADQAPAGGHYAERVTPVLFGAALPASRAGYHYEQTVYAILSRNAPAGPWQVSVQVRDGAAQTPLVPVGTIAMR